MLAGKTYAPILHARSVEVKAFEKLPEPTKDLIFPLVVARPWPNAKHLSKTWEKLTAAFGHRRFAIDIDPFKRHSDSEKPAAAEFRALFDPTDGHNAYYQQVGEIEEAIPTLQFNEGHIEDLGRQLEHASELDRGIVLRLQHGIAEQPVATVRRVIASFPETTIFLDAGWSNDLLGRELWASGIIEAVSESEAEREIVVAGSSFPESFRKLARDEWRADERVMFDNLARRYNSVVLTYGDWGSTRLPRSPTPMGTIPPRIELPRSREWICFRQEGSESYREIASRVLADAAWPADLLIWGTYLIAATAEGLPDGIKGQTAAAAARVNIHLHRQAHFGASGSFGDEDEPFTDDL